MIAHCTPVLLRSSSFWISGAAIDTIVWSMNVIATAKIIAAKIRFLEPPPVALMLIGPRFSAILYAAIARRRKELESAAAMAPNRLKAPRARADA